MTVRELIELLQIAEDKYGSDADVIWEDTHGSRPVRDIQVKESLMTERYRLRPRPEFWYEPTVVLRPSSPRDA